MTDWKDVKFALENLKTDEDVRKLFIEKSNFDYVNKRLDGIDFSPQINRTKRKNGRSASKRNFKIILCKINALLKGIERPAVQAISRYYLNNLIVFTDKRD